MIRPKGVETGDDGVRLDKEVWVHLLVHLLRETETDLGPTVDVQVHNA